MPHSPAEKCTGRNEGRGTDEGAKAGQKLTSHEGSNTSFEDEPMDQDRGDDNAGHFDNLPVMPLSLAKKCTGWNEGRGVDEGGIGEEIGEQGGDADKMDIVLKMGAFEEKIRAHTLRRRSVIKAVLALTRAGWRAVLALTRAGWRVMPALTKGRTQ